MEDGNVTSLEMLHLCTYIGLTSKQMEKMKENDLQIVNYTDEDNNQSGYIIPKSQVLDWLDTVMLTKKTN